MCFVFLIMSFLRRILKFKLDAIEIKKFLTLLDRQSDKNSNSCSVCDVSILYKLYEKSLQC